MDKEDYVQCLELAKKQVLPGPHTLIYDGDPATMNGKA